MKLIDLLCAIDDVCNVIVWKGEESYIYDGRDAIPEELNNDEVKEVAHSPEAIIICVR